MDLVGLHFSNISVIYYMLCSFINFLPGCLALFAIGGPYGDICAGFSLTGTEFTAGSLRLLFSFSAGLLLFRIFKPVKVKGAFWIFLILCIWCIIRLFICITLG